MGMVPCAWNRHDRFRVDRSRHHARGHNRHGLDPRLADDFQRHRGGFHGFQVRSWGGFFLHLLGGIVGVLIGLLVVTHPVAGALAWTLLFASFFTVIGLFRLIAATRLKFPNWGWAAFDGAVTLLLGILLWADWPWSGFWFQ